MNFVLQPWQLFLLIIANWSNQQQQQWIDYLETQCAVLIEPFGKRRILLTDVLLGLSDGVSGFAKLLLQQFNAAPPGSQMRTSMLLAGMKLIIQQAKDLDESETRIEDMTDRELDDHLKAFHGKHEAE